MTWSGGVNTSARGDLPSCILPARWPSAEGRRIPGAAYTPVGRKEQRLSRWSMGMGPPERLGSCCGGQPRSGRILPRLLCVRRDQPAAGPPAKMISCPLKASTTSQEARKQEDGGRGSPARSARRVGYERATRAHHCRVSPGCPLSSGVHHEGAVSIWSEGIAAAETGRSRTGVVGHRRAFCRFGTRRRRLASRCGAGGHLFEGARR